MKPNRILTAASLLSIFLFTAHLAGDIVRGIEKGDLQNLPAIPMIALWLYGTLMLAERRSGYVIIFVFSFLGMGIPVIHMMGKGIGVAARLSKYSGHFFFVFTLLALGATALFSVVVAGQELWTQRRRGAR